MKVNITIPKEVLKKIDEFSKEMSKPENIERMLEIARAEVARGYQLGSNVRVDTGRLRRFERYESLYAYQHSLLSLRLMMFLGVMTPDEYVEWLYPQARKAKLN